jgi:hypothetical protein
LKCDKVVLAKSHEKVNDCKIGNDFAQGKTQWLWNQHVQGKSQRMSHNNEYVCYNANSSY